MPSPDQRPIVYSRLSSSVPVPARVEARPSRGQSATEYALFGAAALLVGLALTALYTSYSPDHQKVPNTVAQGLKADRLNLLVIETDRESQPIGARDWATNLTLVSIRPGTHQAALVTLPGDLWVNLGAYGTHRLNSTNSIGNSSGYPGQGPGLTMDTVARVTGQPVNAFVCMDASDLRSIIDKLGGIDIDVKRPLYRIENRRRFLPGPQHMDGATAVLYANTTDVVGPESDRFARGRRQQQLLSAVAHRLAAVSTSDHGLSLVAEMLKTSPDLRTNLPSGDVASVYESFLQVPRANVQFRSMQDLTSPVEISSISESGEVLQPKTGNFEEIQRLARDPFSSSPAAAAPAVASTTSSKAAPHATFASMR